MNPYIKLFLVFFLFIIPSFTSVAKDKFVLVIDPGHGGKDPGCMTSKSKEKDIVLDVALLLGDLIKSNCPDVNIIYTRKIDKFIVLDQRAIIANKAKADLFISIHVNDASPNKRPSGTETFTLGLSRAGDNLEVAKRENSVILMEDDYKTRYQGFDPRSSESYIIFEFIQNKYMEQSVFLASAIQKEFRNYSKRSDRGVKQDGFLVLRETSMPSVLVELGFISNSEEERYMTSSSGQKKLAGAIYNAFIQYKSVHDRKKGVYSQVIPVKDTSSPVKKEEPSDESKNAENMDDTDNKAVIAENKVITTPVRTKTETQPVKASSTGIVYKVQIQTSDKEIPVNSPLWKGYKVESYKDNNMYKYVYGNYTNMDDAKKAKKQVEQLFKGAFIVSFKDGVRIK